MKRSRLKPLRIILVALLIGGVAVWPVADETRQDAKNRALILAIDRTQPGMVTRLLNEGADANAKYLPKNIRPFWRICWDRLRRRLRPKVNNAPTALQIACSDIPKVNDDWSSEEEAEPERTRNPSIVRSLLEHGADVNVVDQSGYTPLAQALLSRQTEVDLLLIAHGANLMDRRAGRRAPLFVQATEDESDPRVLQAMLDRGANINAQEAKDGRTALMAAADDKNVALTRFLLRHHADTAILDHKGHTALYHALHDETGIALASIPNQCHQVIRLLCQAGAH